MAIVAPPLRTWVGAHDHVLAPVVCGAPPTCLSRFAHLFFVGDAASCDVCVCIERNPLANDRSTGRRREGRGDHSSFSWKKDVSFCGGVLWGTVVALLWGLVGDLLRGCGNGCLLPFADLLGPLSPTEAVQYRTALRDLCVLFDASHLEPVDHSLPPLATCPSDGRVETNDCDLPSCRSLTHL
jgi:hypothetical protein